jgi:heterodisulfide reductase subunit A
MTLSEVTGVSGQAGNFTIQVKKSPRYVDMQKCIACGLCTEKCPKKVDDEFNMGIGKRKAAYIKYGQSVPLKYAIDPNNCIYLTRGKCRACEKFCPTGAINFDDRVETVDVNVGSVILAPGYKPFDPSPFDFYGYGKIPDVVTSLEYERLLSASGPCMGHLTRPSDQREPEKVAWIQCVGSRNTNKCDNGYCSSVCCMYAIKQSLVTAEHLTGDKLEQSIFYMDIRSHGKAFESFTKTPNKRACAFCGPGRIPSIRALTAPGW